MFAFKHAEHSTLAEIEAIIGKDLIIKRAFEAIDKASWTEEELRTYEHMTKVELDNLAVEQQKIEDAEARGEAKGNAEGKAELIQMMLNSGNSIEVISNITGLSVAEIEKLISG